MSGIIKYVAVAFVSCLACAGCETPRGMDRTADRSSLLPSPILVMSDNVGTAEPESDNARPESGLDSNQADPFSLALLGRNDGRLGAAPEQTSVVEQAYVVSHREFLRVISGKTRD